ncbi:hypothetical protein EQG67_18160 [Kosakonia cowanii]|nr:hypothetical protein EQG67_18160 [Kosakonia cowanii]
MALRLSGLRFCGRFRAFVGRIRRQPPSGKMPDGAALIRPTVLWSVSGFCRPVKARRHPAKMPDGAALIRPTVLWSVSGVCRPDKAPAAIRQCVPISQ